MYVTVGTVAVMSLIIVTVLLAIDIPFSILHDWVHSYSDNLNLAKSKNTDRVTHALDYIYSLESPAIEIPKDMHNIDILIVIVTVSREREVRSETHGYLIQTAASMAQLMKKDTSFPRKFMFVCNVDENLKHHRDAIKLQAYFPFIQKGGASNLGFNVSDIPVLKHSGLVDNARRQEIIDYAYCLNATLAFNYSYALIIDDDVVPYDDVFEVLDNVFKYKLSIQRHAFNEQGQTVNRNFSFLKLYYPQRWQGFAWETDRVLELISIGTVGGAICIIVAAVTDYLLYRHRSSTYFTLPTFCSGFVVTVILAYILGRVNIIELRRLTPYIYKFVRSSACCTQAMLYKRETLPQLIDHLLVNNSRNKDLAIYDFSEKYDIPGYQLEPNLFRHTGMLSSLSLTGIRPEEYLFDVPAFD